MDQPEEKLLKLRKPVRIKGDDTTYTELSLREPTVDELDRAQKADTNIGIAANLICFVAGVPLLVVKGMGQRDFQEANEYLAGFTLDGPTTGKD